MANDLNQCNFIGRLGKDPEVRQLPSGDKVTNFSIAVGSSWKDKQTGQKKEHTEWIDIDTFGGLAGVCGEYLRKGSKVFVSGEFKTRKWEDQSGNTRYSTSIKARDMQMLDSRSDAGSSPPDAGQGSSQPSNNFDDGDIPF
jgi:single-strand DNA-binding protein